MAVDLIGIMTGEPAERIELDVRIDLPAGSASTSGAPSTSGKRRRAQEEAARELRTAARELRDRGPSMRESGEVLGLSYQLVSDPRAA